MKIAVSVYTVICSLLAAAPASTASDLPAGFKESMVVTGLRDPSTMEFGPDGRLFVAERIVGKLRIVTPDGVLLERSFLAVDTPRDASGRPQRHRSSGLRGFAFDPNFPDDPYVYVFYMRNQPRHNRVSRFRVPRDHPNLADPATEEVLLELPFNSTRSSGSHNGGALIFDNDGYLYITTGDGWNGGDPVQSLDTYTGKVFRIRRDGSIPADNPFYDRTRGSLRAVYCLGFRNPFTVARHPRTGKIYINDCAPRGPLKSNIYEMVSGGNYKYGKGDDGKGLDWTPARPGTPQDPIAVGGRTLISGGAWYPDDGPFPAEYQGDYFIALWGHNDASPGRLSRVLVPPGWKGDDRPGETGRRVGNRKLLPVETFAAKTGGGLEGKPVHTKIGPDGNLYWLATTYETTTGTVYRIEYSGDRPQVVQPRIIPNGGKFFVAVEVRLTTSTPDAEIYYTLDGKTPTTSSRLYNGPLTITGGARIKARAFRSASDASSVVTASFERITDRSPPSIAAVLVTEPSSVRVVFDEAVNRLEAEEISSYGIHPDATIKAASLDADFKTVILTTTPLSRGDAYTLTVKHAADRSRPPNSLPHELRRDFTSAPARRSIGLASRLPVRPYLNLPESARGRIPPLLSQTGAFGDVLSLTPAPGIIPYAVNVAAWADGAVMRRWIALPSDGPPYGAGEQVSYSRQGRWTFPRGTVLIQQLDVIRDRRTRERRRLETRLLVADAHGGYYGVTYRWRRDSLDADLLEERAVEGIRVQDDDGAEQIRSWQYPGRFDCLSCHNPSAGFVLGVNARQLNRGFTYPQSGITGNQLRTWNALEFFAERLTEDEIGSASRLSAVGERSAPIEHRARSYLDVNCANCHQPGGIGTTAIDLRYELKGKEAKTLGVAPLLGSFGVPGARIISPGDPCRSILFYRMATQGRGRMPYVGSTVVDEAALALLGKWIEEREQKAVHDDEAALLQARKREEVALSKLASRARGSSGARGKALDSLLASTSGALAVTRAIDRGSLPSPVREEAVTRGAQHDRAEVRDLFQRFIPEAKRTGLLGSVIDPADVLRLEGNRERGERLYFNVDGVSCRSCHRIGKRGQDTGPELTRIGGKYSREKLLESILEPSREIDQEYRAYLVVTKKGRLYTGLLELSASEGDVTLKDANGKKVRVRKNEIAELVEQRTSIMPELLLRDLTAQQATDLLEYLSSLK